MERRSEKPIGSAYPNVNSVRPRHGIARIVLESCGVLRQARNGAARKGQARRVMLRQARRGMAVRGRVWLGVVWQISDTAHKEKPGARTPGGTETAKQPVLVF